MGKTAIIGFGSAGYAALMAVKKNMPEEVITVIDPKSFDLLHPCGLPYALEGLVPVEKITQNIGLDRMKVRKIRGRAVKIDQEAREIIVDTGGTESRLEYDSALVALGSRPLIPPVSGINARLNQDLFTLTSLEDLHFILKKVNGSRSCLVIGGGAIGLETAAALKKILPSVKVLERKPQLLPGVLDADLAKTVEDFMKRSGVEIVLGAGAEAFPGGDSFAVSGAFGSLTADMGVLAAGFRPNTGLAEDSGLECGPFGIVTDRFLRAGSQGVFAAGDCLSSWSVIDGKPVGAKLATSAYKQGTLAGRNMCGAGEEYGGTAATFVTIIGGMEIAGTGYGTESARENGYEPVSGKITSGVLPEYFPGGGDVAVKIIADKKTGKLLGAQAVGAGAASRINLISMALEFAVPLDRIERLEMAYCPAVSEVHDPLLRAVDFVMRRMNR